MARKGLNAISHVPPIFAPPDVTTMQGYTSRLSGAPEDNIAFRMSTVADSYTVTFRKLGKRGGPVDVLENVKGRLQFAPERAWETGCDWLTDFFWVIPEDAPSGMYSAECVDSKGSRFNIPFIVKPRFDKRNKIACLGSTNTWNAYNGWGGMSAYSEPQPRTLSLDRPMPVANPEGEGRNHLVRAEMWVLDWMAESGYSVDVYSDIDLHRGWDWLEEYSALVVSTHSEYWTEPMRDHLDAYLDSGGSLLYLSGNGMYWKVTYDPTCRVMEIRKDGKPHYQTGEEGGLWRNLGRPEHNVLGVGYARPGYMTFAPYRIEDPSHWIFEGLGLKEGDLIGGEGINGGAASGWEADQVREGWSPANMAVLAKGINPVDYMPPGTSIVYPEPNYEWDGSGGAHMTYYDHPGGGGVFSVGSIAFGGSLVVDEQIQGVVGNVLDRFLK
jgi:N,N-dimethylformamidase